MILKKPYAFLIKNFKLIHLLSLIGLVFIVSKTNGLISFFSSYSNTGNYLYNNNVIIEYISLSVFLIIVLMIGLYAVIGFLLKKKNKPFNVYIFICIYYLILLVFLFFINALISGLGENILDGRAIRIYRDITIIFTLPQYYFIGFNFIRGIGFDLKKFDFNKDLVDIQVESGDDEEIEFEIGAESYKYKRIVRRFLRELRYYILENKLGFIIASAALIIIFAIFFKVTATDSITYDSVNNYFTVDDFNIRVNDSIVTKYDLNGEVIDGNYYLILNVDIYNQWIPRKFNYDNVFLVIDDGEFSYPTTIFKEKFMDLGQVYLGESIEKGESVNRLLVFPFRKKDLSSKYLIRSLKSLSYSEGALSLHFNEHKVKPTNMYELEGVRTVKLGEEMNFAGSTVRNSKVTVSSFEFTKTYNYNYNFCLKDGDCQKSVGTIKPKAESSAFTLLALPYDAVFSENITFDINHKEEFFNRFMKVEYTIDGNTKSISTNYIGNDLIKNVYLTQIRSEVATADSIALVFKVRTKTFKIILK